MSAVHWPVLLAIALPALACGFTGICLAATLAQRWRRPPPPLDRWPAIAVLRPTEPEVGPTRQHVGPAGGEVTSGRAQLLARLQSTLSADYPGPLTLLVACGGVAPNVSALRPLTDDSRAKLLASPLPETATGVNRKAVHLEVARTALPALAPSAELVLAIDDDVQVTGSLLRDLVRGALRPGAVAAFAPPIQRGRRLASLVGEAALGTGPHAFAVLAALAKLRRAAPPLVGCAIAVRRQPLADVGGFAPSTRVIGDDLALGEALARLGRIEVTPTFADCRDPRLGLLGLLRQLSRWIRVATAHRPGLWAAYPLLIAPLPLSALVAVLSSAVGDPTLPLRALALVYGVRIALAAVLRSAGLGRGWRAPLDPLVADLAWTLAFALALAPGALRWRGRAYAVGRGGILSEAPPPAPATAPDIASANAR